MGNEPRNQYTAAGGPQIYEAVIRRPPDGDVQPLTMGTPLSLFPLLDLYFRGVSFFPDSDCSVIKTLKDGEVLAIELEYTGHVGAKTQANTTVYVILCREFQGIGFSWRMHLKHFTRQNSPF